MNIRVPYEETYNYYGDESSHMKDDGNKFMALGALCCPQNLSKRFSDEIRQIKLSYGFTKDFEIKCTKVSLGALDFYQKLIEWFLSCPDLYFRIVLINKELVKTSDADGYNLFYYKMYYTLFRYFMHGTTNHIYLDYKDSRSYLRCAEIQEIFGNDHVTRMKKILFSKSIQKKAILFKLQICLLVCFAITLMEKRQMKPSFNW